MIGSRRDKARRRPQEEIPEAGAPVPAAALLAALNQWPEAVILIDGSNRVVRANLAAESLTEGSDRPIVGRDVLSLVHVDDRSIVRSDFDMLRAGGPGLHREFRIITESGAEQWVDATVARVLQADGVEGLLLQARDCTARKKAEFHAQRAGISAREADRRYRVAFESTLVGVATADIDGFYVDVNPALCQLLGFERTELVGRHLTGAVHAEDAPLVDQTIGVMVTASLPGARQHQIRYVRADGEVIVVEAAFVPIRDDNGAPLSLMIFSQDVTARHKAHAALQDAFERERQASQQLRELEETRARLLAAVSHDFRTPLSAIAGFADLMYSGWDDYSDEQKRDFAERITRNASELDDRVTEFLDVARHDHATGDAALVPCRLEELAQQAIQRCRFVLDTHTVDFAPEPAEVQTEPLAVGRIIDNLLTNAAKYSPNGSLITVTVGTSPDGTTFVTVSDEGPGIPAAEKERIFEPFVRLAGTAQDAPGVGVGLGGARALAERLGGTLTVRDNTPVGSTFTLTLRGSTPG